jgi:type 1 glutamine amidotransferase
VWIRWALLALLLVGGLTSCGGDEPRVVVLSRTTAYRHGEAIAAGREALERRFGAEVVGDLSDLRGVDVVVLLQTNGEDVVRGPERGPFERWVRDGGGVVAIHAAANTDRDWPFYGELLGGARFRNHPPGSLQFQQATITVEDRSTPATLPLPRRWTRTDEWYNFAPEPGPAAHVVATLDERTYEESDGSEAPDQHPIAWWTRAGRGRAFYTALGHGAESWSDPLYRAHMFGAVEWAAGG